MRLSLDQSAEVVLQNILHSVTATCPIDGSLLGVIELSTYDILNALQENGLTELEFTFRQDLRRLEFNYDLSNCPVSKMTKFPAFFEQYFLSEERSYFYRLVDGINCVSPDNELQVYYNLSYLSEDVYTQRVMLLRAYFSLHSLVMDSK